MFQQWVLCLFSYVQYAQQKHQTFKYCVKCCRWKWDIRTLTLSLDFLAFWQWIGKEELTLVLQVATYTTRLPTPRWKIMELEYDQKAGR